MEVGQEDLREHKLLQSSSSLLAIPLLWDRFSRYGPVFHHHHCCYLDRCSAKVAVDLNKLASIS